MFGTKQNTPFIRDVCALGVLGGRLELPWVAPRAPKARAYTNSAIPASASERP